MYRGHIRDALPSIRQHPLQQGDDGGQHLATHPIRFAAQDRWRLGVFAIEGFPDQRSYAHLRGRHRL
jgi:hypothetical protein